MRKAQKKQAEEFIKLLAQVHEEIRGFLECEDYPAVKELLGQCQEGAVELGNFIETMEGQGIEIISLLENYCELVYQIHEEITGDQEVSGNKILKRLKQSLLRIENSLRNDIKTRYEIVFMPYKASMWDSLESVWRAASEDPDCDVYVVPIPYYDKNSDQSFGDYHYEGSSFPEEVPIVHYRSYDLEQRRPDVIYIHNPYDEKNRVTSVAPQFYTSKIKWYTECLTYIPYCVYEEKENPNSDKTIAYCSRYISYGILYADKVILQSENFRRSMINTLLANAGNNRNYWENKVLGLGSPKYDRVFDTDRDVKHLPEEWKRLVTRADGSRKKIVFYNTSMSAMTKYSGQMIRKIQTVLQLFYEKREECVLLWRPHPLIRASIESMRPELWEEYKKIVEEYREEGWGIYDDTPDFHAAFALSDAYYGDYSSLVLLYQATGKPLLEQNVEILDYRKRFVTDKLYYDGEYLWGTAREFNGLFRIDPDTYEIKYMGRFPNEKAEEYRLFIDIAEYGGRLYFCPYNAENIAVYDKKTLQFHNISLRKDMKETDKKFGTILSHGKYMYLRGSKIHAIAQINTETDEVVYIENWREELGKRQIGNSESLIRSGCICGNDLYCLSYKGNGILHTCLRDLSYEYIPLDYNGEHFFSEIMSADRKLWLLSQREGSILCMDADTLAFTKNFSITNVNKCCVINEYIYCFPSSEPYFYRINMQSKETDTFAVDNKIYSVGIIENRIYMTTYISGELYVFDVNTLEMRKTAIFLDEESILWMNNAKLLEPNKKGNQYARESGFINLRNLCGMDKADNNKQLMLKNDSCGERIHKYVKNVVC